MKRKIIFLLIVCFVLVGCGGKLTDEKIKEKLEVKTEERTFTVNKVTYATDKIVINANEMYVDGKKVTLGDYFFEDVENNVQITGFYEQTGAVFSIYRLTKDNNEKTTVWKAVEDNVTSFEDLKWENANIKNATDLILIDCTETMEEFGQTPLRYQVYALVNNDLVLVE